MVPGAELRVAQCLGIGDSLKALRLKRIFSGASVIDSFAEDESII